MEVSGGAREEDLQAHCARWREFDSLMPRACQDIFPRKMNVLFLQPTIETEGRPGARRIGAQKRATKCHAAQPEDGRQQARRGGARGEGASHAKPGATVKTWQIEALGKLQSRHQKPARKRVKHHPALCILDGGEAVAKAALERIKPGLIRMTTKDDPNGLWRIFKPCVGGARFHATIPLTRSGHSSRSSASRQSRQSCFSEG